MSCLLVGTPGVITARGRTPPRPEAEMEHSGSGEHAIKNMFFKGRGELEVDNAAKQS